MTLPKLINCSLVLGGTVVLLLSIVKSGQLLTAIPYVAERHRKQISRRIAILRGLMVFFFRGYVVGLQALMYGWSEFSESVMSVMFLGGASFVFIGNSVKSKLLEEIQRTLLGILPICATGKNIRVADGDADDPAAWRKLKAYISERAAVEFSHGYCPQCYAEEMQQLEAMKTQP